MAAPAAQLRQHLSAPGLLSAVRKSFNQIADPRQRRPEIPLADALMSGLAVFSLKYAALLQFDKAYDQDPTLRHNLRTLYGIEKAPCDTHLRTILDEINPQLLGDAFVQVHRQLQRGKALEAYRYWDDQYLLSIDGTGQFSSSAISCPHCCEKNTRAGQKSYYHQLLGAVIVHPQLKTVLPLMPEAMTRQDGSQKNDCERVASKRLLRRVREDFPQRKFIVLEDSLASNGPHIELLKELKLSFILGVKPSDHKALFDAVHDPAQGGPCQEWSELDAKGVERGYRWQNDLSLNASYPQLKVNYLEYWEVANGRERVWSWVTDIALEKQTLERVMRAGRARWKVENETFNTLKNQGYAFEHNFGHGQQNLSVVFAMLMMLAFLVDQTQQICCPLFRAVWKKLGSKRALWDNLRSHFRHFTFTSMQHLYEVILHDLAKELPAPRLDTS